MSYEQIVTGEITSALAESHRTVERGRGASAVMADPVVTEFFTEHTRDLVKALLSADTSNIEAIRTIVVGIRAVNALHGHLSAAITAGTAAALRLTEQAKEQNS